MTKRVGGGDRLGQSKASPGGFRGPRRISALLLKLVQRASRLWLWDWLRRSARRLRTWQRRQSNYAATAHRALLETLEPRLLLSADLVPAAAGAMAHFQHHDQQHDQQRFERVLAQDDVGVLSRPASLASDTPRRTALAAGAEVAAATATAATAASVILSGPGTGQLLLQNNGSYTLQLDGTSTLTQVSLDITGGNGRITLSSITAGNAVGALNLANADLAGQVNLPGGTASLTLGQVSASLIDIGSTADTAFKATTVTNTRLRSGSINLSVDVTS